MSEEQVAEVSQEVAPSDAQADWRSQIPEEIAGHKSLEHINDVGALAKSYVNAQSMIGADKLAIPGKYATPDDWVEVDRRLGRPDNVEGYELKMELPDGVEQNEAMVGSFKEAALDAGLRPGQAQKLLDWYNNEMGSAVQADGAANETRMADTQAELTREYGAALDDKLNNALGVMMEFGSKEQIDFGNGPEEASWIEGVRLQDGSSLANHPEMIRTFSNIADFINERIGEDTLEGVKSSNQMMPNDIAAQISQIDANPAYLDKRNPQQPFLVQERLRLQEMLNQAMG